MRLDGTGAWRIATQEPGPLEEEDESRDHSAEEQSGREPTEVRFGTGRMFPAVDGVVQAFE